ncbi:MAG: Crp/Fnr family transcriptional regulator [Pedobacter sp.]|nr:MAG: Crp/Fnr family transcriptional regulator [Pedobacter sp.]
MSAALITHMERFVHIPADQQSVINSFFKSHTYKKKEILLKQGEICRSNYFVVKGCLRMYFITEKGVEHTMQFALENWWLTDVLAFNLQKTTEFYIQAVEATEVLCIDFNRLEQLYDQVPLTEKYFRLIYQKAAGASQQKAKYFQDFTKEELYNQFNSSFPEFIQRVPQYLIASYLGFTPEYLSEIRKKNLS